MATALREHPPAVPVMETEPAHRSRLVTPPWLTPDIQVGAFTALIAIAAAVIYLASPAARMVTVTCAIAGVQGAIWPVVVSVKVNGVGSPTEGV